MLAECCYENQEQIAKNILIDIAGEIPDVDKIDIEDRRTLYELLNNSAVAKLMGALFILKFSKWTTMDTHFVDAHSARKLSHGHRPRLQRSRNQRIDPG